MSDLEDYQIQYDYASKITPHEDLGVKKNGRNSSIKKGVKAIDKYINALKTGTTTAVKDSSALGNKYFHNLGIKCTSKKYDIDSEEYETEEDLYTYYDNVPKEVDNDGLVAGIQDHIDHMNDASQLDLYNKMHYDSDDKVMCKKVLCELRNDDHETRKDTAYVSENEFNNLIADETSGCIDYLTSDKEFSRSENFKNLKEVSSKLPEDPMITGYYTLLSILGLYFIYNCTINKK